MRRKNGSGTMYRRNGVWYAQIMVNGKLVRRSTGETVKKKAAERLDAMAQGYDLSDEVRLAAVATALQSRRRPDIEIGNALKAFFDAPCNQEISEGARRCITSSWRVFSRWLHGGPKYGKRKATLPAHPEISMMDEVTEAIVGQFATEIRKQYAPMTCRDTVQTLRRIWKTLKIEPNPWNALPPIKGEAHLRKAFTNEELKRIIDKADGELKTLLIVGAYTGLRLSDAAKLQWEQITSAVDAVILRPHKTAHSSGRIVAIPIHATLKAALGPHKGAGYVMPKIALLSQPGRCEAVQRHLRKCGIATTTEIEGYRRKAADYGFHSLRSTFISRLADAGMPLAQIQGMVGHVSPEMTQHYYRQDAEAARGILDKLPNLVNF